MIDIQKILSEKCCVAMAKILIIDDEREIVNILLKTIHRSGHQANSSFTLNDGLQEALSEDYDVVFLDVHLSDGNGLDAVPTKAVLKRLAGYRDWDGLSYISF